ncbi:MAG: arginine repressor [Myxococcota bacterium]
MEAGRIIELESRRKALLGLIQEGDYRSQNALREAMMELGFEVTQATLSRDLNHLGVAKVPGPDGSKSYRRVTPNRSDGAQSGIQSDLRSQVVGSKVVGQLVLVFTLPGSAGLVGRVLDELGWGEIEGCVAGDDTLLVVAADAGAARELNAKVENLRSNPNAGL